MIGLAEDGRAYVTVNAPNRSVESVLSTTWPDPFTAPALYSVTFAATGLHAVCTRPTATLVASNAHAAGHKIAAAVEKKMWILWMS